MVKSKVALITIGYIYDIVVMNPVRPDSSVGRASGICSGGPGFNPQFSHLF